MPTAGATSGSAGAICTEPTLSDQSWQIVTQIPGIGMSLPRSLRARLEAKTHPATQPPSHTTAQPLRDIRDIIGRTERQRNAAPLLAPVMAHTHVTA